MERVIAKDLLSIQAVYLRLDDPFLWSSGIRAPIYCDNRLTLSDVAVRDHVEQALSDIVRKHYPDCEMLMGTSTAGIPHAAYISSILRLPMGYVRSHAKDHGIGHQIEGRCDPGTKVVIVEDLVSTAGSVVTVAKSLREAGAEILGIASIFTYGMKKAAERFEENHLKNVSASNLDVLLEVASEEGYIKKEQIPAIRAFRDDPFDQHWMELI